MDKLLYISSIVVAASLAGAVEPEHEAKYLRHPHRPHSETVNVNNAWKKMRQLKLKDVFGLGTNKDWLDVVTLTGATPPGPPVESPEETDMAIGTNDVLPSYFLSTDKEHYKMDDSVTVTWDITDRKGRRLLEPEPMIDENDVTLYRLGIYMRMSNPKAGQLEPLLDHPFCKHPCTTPPDELMTGTWKFEIKDLPDPHPMTLGEYDVWVLNGEGAGIAGPVIWKLKE